MWHQGEERVRDKVGEFVGATSPRNTFVCKGRRGVCHRG